VDLVVAWPQLEELRRAGRHKGRWGQALSSLVATAKVEMLAAMRAARKYAAGLGNSVQADVDCAVLVVHGSLRHEALRLLQNGGLCVLATAWKWLQGLEGEAAAAVRGIVGVASEGEQGVFVEFSAEELSQPSEIFPHVAASFGAALAAGTDWARSVVGHTKLFVGWYSRDGRRFRCRSASGEPAGGRNPGRCVSFGASGKDGEPDVTLHWVGDELLGVTSSANLRLSSPANATRLGSVHAKNTRWLPAYIRLPRDRRGGIARQLPLVSVVDRKHVWRRLLGNIDAVTWAIISGQMVYPRRGWMLQASWLRNHPSWDQPRARLKLGHKFGQWLYQGALEWVPPWAPPPMYVEPMGAVPKKGPDEFRAIADARHGNKGLEPWGVKYYSVRDFVDLLDWCYILSGTDWRDAYHNSRMAGCTGEVVVGIGVVGIEYTCAEGDSGSDTSGEDDDEVHCGLSPAQEYAPPEAGQQPSKATVRRYHSRQRLVWGHKSHVGCTPESCLQVCDKSACGCATDGCVMRWAAAHFGQGPAGSGLNCLALCLLRHLARRDPHPGERRGASGRTVLGAVWVDDFGLAQFVRRHQRCQGLKGACSICLEYIAAARLNREYWISLCDQLAIHLADDKHQDLAQTLEYGGFRIDTLEGVLSATQDKLSKLLAGLVEWRQTSVTSVLSIAEHRGRLIHYSLGINHLRVLSTELTWYIGTEEKPDYDRQVDMDANLSAVADEIVHVVRVFGPLGRPLWPPVASSLLGAFERGEARDNLAVLSTDSSPVGWAALLRWWEGTHIRELMLIGSWPAGAPISEQVHREALGVVSAYREALSGKDLCGWAVLQRNDAQAVIAALTKGSSRSRVMQDMALEVNRLSALQRVQLIPMHVPGTALVDEGIDGASRDGDDLGPGANASALLGPAISDELWALVRATAADVGWELSIDRFASASNRRLARFNSRFPEPEAEATDSLAQIDWNSSTCPVCGKQHREVNYIFAPRAVERMALRKAIADGARVIVLMALAVTHPFWHKLIRASVVRNTDGYIRVKGLRARLSHSPGEGPRELALFACDFSSSTPRQTQVVGPPCAGFFARRPKVFEGVGPEDATLRRLRAELQRLPGWRG
jgi:hypothetical protein